MKFPGTQKISRVLAAIYDLTGLMHDLLLDTNSLVELTEAYVIGYLSVALFRFVLGRNDLLMFIERVLAWDYYDKR